MTEDEIEELQEEVRSLKDRVGHLERELGTSVREERFKNMISRLFKSDEVETSQDNMGHFNAEAPVEVFEVQDIIRRVDKREGYDWELLEDEDENLRMKIRQGVYRG